ncbi:putative anion transporter 6 [Citrus sinensis]|uniref:Anion transporter 6 n=1 Tax=Citrus sinensis TaxID=2711 RepID=A0ACB8P4T1_CITSI|nr:putative anion transporter 6 [Citrus sinensis]
MAKLTLGAENFFVFAHNTGSGRLVFAKSNSFKRQKFHLYPSEGCSRLRVSCSIKEKENVKEETDKFDEVLTGLRVDEPGSVSGFDSESGLVRGTEEVGRASYWPPWKNIPQRYKLIGTTSLAFVVCNMDKVNLSVAIIPMSHCFGWNSSVAGLVQSSFFWGYALSQLPGGWLAKIFGGRKVLQTGVLIWSLATALLPLLAGFMPGLVLSIPLEERSRAVSFVFGGLSFGSVAGLLLAPPIIENLGWESVFYIFGLLGIACEELSLNLTEAAWVSILPPLASVLVTSIAAQFADNLIATGVETTMVRKICQTIAFLSPAVCMTLSSIDLGLPHWEIVGILTAGLALSSFALSGLYCTHQDISPEYASILLGITNTVGAVPGIVGVALTGYLLDSTHSWSMSLFAPSIFFYLTGTIVWLAFASSKPQNFSTRD